MTDSLSANQPDPGGVVAEQPEQRLSPEEEIAELEKLLAQEPDDFQARCRLVEMYYSNLGTIYATKNMGDEAEAQFKKALELNAYDVLALFNLGRLHSEKRQFVEAKNFYERLVEITPDDPIAWYNLGGVYVELDNPAVSDYNTIDMAMQCY